jgi:hypothetical protein
VEQEVGDAGRPSRFAEQPVEQGRNLRPDAGQGRRRREKRVELEGPQGHSRIGVASPDADAI